jgi:hypothetical protein
MGWATPLDDPIPLPKGKPLATLRDAALYMTKLPKAEHDAEEWQAAMQVCSQVKAYIFGSTRTNPRPRH